MIVRRGSRSPLGPQGVGATFGSGGHGFSWGVAEPNARDLRPRDGVVVKGLRGATFAAGGEPEGLA